MAKKFLHTLTGEHSEWHMKIVYYSFVLIFALIPLVFTFRLKSVFTLPKLYIFALLTLIIAVGFLYQLKKGFQLRDTKLHFYIGLYVVSLMCSLIFSENIYTSLFGDYGRFVGFFMISSLLCFFYFISQIITTKKQVVTLLATTYVAVSITVILGVLQHYGLWLSSIELTSVGQRAFGTYGHANHFGAVIVQFFWVGLALLLLAKKRPTKIAIIVLELLYLFALFQTSSRGALLAFVGTGVLFFIINRKVLATYLSKKIKIVAVSLLIIMITLSALFFDQVRKVGMVERTIETVEFIQDGNVPDRVSWALSGIEMAQDRPLFGQGISMFRDRYNAYRRLDFKAQQDSQDRIVPESAHNEYINIAATQGLFGLITYLLLIGYVVLQMLRSIQREQDVKKKVIQTSILLAVVTYMLQVFLSFGATSTLILFFGMLGLGYSYTAHESEVQSSNRKKIITGIVLVLFLSLNFYFVHRLTKADRLLRYTDIAPTNEGYDLHIRIMQDAVKTYPYSYDLYKKLAESYISNAIFVSVAAESESDLTQAIRAYAEALSLSDVPAITYTQLAQAYVYIAEVNVQVGAKNKAIEAYNLAEKAHEEALRRAQNNPLYYWRAAETYYADWKFNGNDDDKQKALSLYKRVEEIRPSYQGLTERINDLN